MLLWLFPCLPPSPRKHIQFWGHSHGCPSTPPLHFSTQHLWVSTPSLHWNFLDNSHQWLSDGQIVWAMSALHLGPPSYTEHFLALYSQDFHEFPPRGSVTPSSWHNFYVCASTPRSLLSWILLFELLPKFSFLCPVPLDSILSHTLRYFDLLFMLSLMYLPHLPPSPQVISPTCSCHSINTHTHSHTHAHAPPMPSVLYLHTLWFFNFSSFFQSQGSWRIQHLLFNHRSFLLQPKGGFVKQQMKLYVRRPHCMNPFQGLIHGFEFIIVFFLIKNPQIVQQKATHNLDPFLTQYIKN